MPKRQTGAISMKEKLGVRFWSESILASVSASLAVLTLVWPDWIEGVFGVDPDHHNGSLEWAVVAGCCIATVVCMALARREWQRIALARR
jgi:hypothetical protein